MEPFSTRQRSLSYRPSNSWHNNGQPPPLFKSLSAHENRAFQLLQNSGPVFCTPLRKFLVPFKLWSTPPIARVLVSSLPVWIELRLEILDPKPPPQSFIILSPLSSLARRVLPLSTRASLFRTYPFSVVVRRSLLAISPATVISFCNKMKFLPSFYFFPRFNWAPLDPDVRSPSPQFILSSRLRMPSFFLLRPALLLPPDI